MRYRVTKTYKQVVETVTYVTADNENEAILEADVENVAEKYVKEEKFIHHKVEVVK